MKILINRSDALGDTILTLPLAKIIKDFYPQAQVYYLISPLCLPLFLHHPWIDGVIVDDERSEKKSLIQRFATYWKKLKQIEESGESGKWTHYFYMGGDFIPSAVAFFLRIPFRGGVIHRLNAYLFLNKGQRQKRSLVEFHEAIYNFLTLKELFPVKYFQEKLQHPEQWSPEIFVPESDVLAAQQILQRHLNLKTNDFSYGIIHPGMRGHTLNWSMQSYAELLNQLLQLPTIKTPFFWIISYTDSDRIYIENFRLYFKKFFPQGHHPQVLFWNGQEKGLRFYLELLYGAKIFIGPSTGTMHMAQALKVPLLTFFSPIKVQSAKRWGPFYSQAAAVVLSPDAPCPQAFYCVKEKCQYFDCMNGGQLSVDVALESVKKLLNKSLR